MKWQRHAGVTKVTPEQKEEVHPNATSKVSLSHPSLHSKERYDNLRLGGTLFVSRLELDCQPTELLRYHICS
jgi:hypothetical protein